MTQAQREVAAELEAAWGEDWNGCTTDGWSWPAGGISLEPGVLWCFGFAQSGRMWARGYDADGSFIRRVDIN
jgi:hypothetical protein